MMDGWWWEQPYYATHRQSGIASAHSSTPREKEMKSCTRRPYIWAHAPYWYSTSTQRVRQRQTWKRKYSFAFLATSCIEKGWRGGGKMERLYAAMVTAQMTYRSSFYLTRCFVSSFFFFYPLTLQTPITYSPYYLSPCFSFRHFGRGRGVEGRSFFLLIIIISFCYFLLLWVRKSLLEKVYF